MNVHPQRLLSALSTIAAGAAVIIGAAGIYYNDVVKPNSWPKAAGVVVSSHVVNTNAASRYQPRIVFRVEQRGVSRHITASAPWSSSSYDDVRAHVSRFPAGATVELAVSPNGNEVRYDLGPTRRKLLETGSFGLAGLIIIAVGVRQLRPRPVTLAAARWRAAMVIAVGVAIGGGAAWIFLNTDYSIAEWPTVDAEVVTSGVAPSESPWRFGSRPHDILVTFKYAVDGVTYVNHTVSGNVSSSFDDAKGRLGAYDRGSRHRISHRPGDPNVIFFDVRNMDVDFVPIFIAGLAVVMLVVGASMWRNARTSSEPQYLSYSRQE